MLVFKFGGASVKDGDAVKNVESILREYPGQKIVAVVSAMGKTTNLLEELNAARGSEERVDELLDEVREFHSSIAS
ncbi:MAG: amino acid kinase family protein [Flavobacteriales bacterium]